MASFEQAANAKMFLRDYERALHTLDQIAMHESEISMYNTKKNIVDEAIVNNQITVSGDNVTRGPQFKQSRLANLNRHSKAMFATYLKGFESVTQLSELRKMLKEAVSSI